MSMYQIITVKTPAVHAKDAPRRIIPRPQMSLAEDAARCNHRFRNRAYNGTPTNPANSNRTRMQEARDRDAKFTRIILRLLSNAGEMSRKEIIMATGLSDDVSRVIMRQMREAKLVKVDGKANAVKWSLA